MPSYRETQKNLKLVQDCLQIMNEECEDDQFVGHIEEAQRWLDTASSRADYLAFGNIAITGEARDKAMGVLI